MKKIASMLALVLAIILMAAPASAASTNPKAFFAPVQLTVYDWSKTATSVAGSSMSGTVYYDIEGYRLGVIELGNGQVDYAAGGYEVSIDGLIQAFNEYRGVPHNGYIKPEWEVSKPHNEEATGSSIIIPGNPTGSTPMAQADLDLYRQQVIVLVNAERAAVGLNELDSHDALMDFAQVRAEELVVDYSHTRPDGTRGNEVTKFLVDGSQRACAETIAKGNKNPEAVVTAWMNSTVHYDINMGSNYNYIGVGCYEYDGKLYWVQLFSR